MTALFLFLLAASPEVRPTSVFVSGEGGYHTYRIPALIATKKGTLLAFCEGRKGSSSDAGNIDLLLRRSFDQGRTWQPMQVVSDMGGDTIGNPAPVIDEKSGEILLLLTRNGGAITERMIENGQGQRTVWITRSRDDGATWSEPVEITSQVKRADWTWYATGPGNGIQLRHGRHKGRILVACDHTRATTKARHSHLIYSDDRGSTWKIGGIAEEKTNESAVAELADGELVLNMRSYHGKNRRAIQRSRDSGESLLVSLVLDEALIEPVCQASLIRLGKLLLFSNPAATTRSRMTIRASADGGRTWLAPFLVHQGPSAYSSLAPVRKKAGLLYEHGEKSPYERISFVSVELRKLTRHDQEISKR